jgi:hypothetical protein
MGARNAYTILVGKREEKRQLGRPRRRWEDKIKTNVRGKVLEVKTGLIWRNILTGSGFLCTR